MVDDKKSWFKQFWPWFLIALPMFAVVGSLSLVFTAVKHQPDMVIDDYYTAGKAINHDFALINRAKALNIHASIKQLDDELIISFSGIEEKSSISLSLFHSTLAARDISAMLTADANGDYHFQSDQDLHGKWRIRIEPFDKSWRLQKTIQLPQETFKL
ncbi:MAG: FixH family protein [Psychromonas sp.]